jgi:hypothetical protein
MLGSVAVKHQIAGLQDASIAFMQLALKDQELLVAVVAVAAGRHAWGHFVDVKSGAKGYVAVKLQYAVAQGEAIRVDEGFKGIGMDIGDFAVSVVDGAHGRFLS